jgi:teichuronic acid biosynthesis glycosyltransferase TuaC
VDMRRFGPIPRAEARAELGLDPHSPYLLFPADPARPEKRHDRAAALAQALGVQLLTLGGVDPGRVPLYVNASNAVLVPSEREGFGLAVLEALACDVPVLATPVGIHPQALDGLGGALCAPFELERWRAVAAVHVAAEDPRVAGRERAEPFSATRMAERVARAWRLLVADAG